MNTNAQSNQSADLTAILTASVEEQMKVRKAAEDAKKALVAANEFNAARKAAANVLVSKIQSDMNKQLINAQKAQQEAYEKSMVALGLSAQVYPLETALLITDDKFVKPILGGVGKGAKAVTDISVGIFNRIKAGFNK